MSDPNILPEELLSKFRVSIGELAPVLESGLVPFLTYVYREGWANGYSEGYRDADRDAVERPES